MGRRITQNSKKIMGIRVVLAVYQHEPDYAESFAVSGDGNLSFLIDEHNNLSVFSEVGLISYYPAGTWFRLYVDY